MIARIASATALAAEGGAKATLAAMHVITAAICAAVLVSGVRPSR